MYGLSRAPQKGEVEWLNSDIPKDAFEINLMESTPMNECFIRERITRDEIDKGFAVPGAELKGPYVSKVKD